MADDETAETAARPAAVDPRYQYLGDGVYASFDGHNVWLHVGAHTNAPVVALEAEVLEALFRYALTVQSDRSKL